MQNEGMKAVIGVDVNGLYESALNFIGRLEFPRTEVDLLHIDELSGLTPPESFAWTAQVAEIQRDTDDRILLNAEELAQNFKLKVSAINTFVGMPAPSLIDRADAIHADILAIGSTQKSKYGSFFFGSVGRALAIGSKHSVLIAKGKVPTFGQVTATLATDHSKYADDAILMLARMEPKGFKKLILLTALEHEMMEGANEAEQDDFRKFMEAKSLRMIEHLKEAGIEAEFKVVIGELGDVIDRQMKLNESELLIMGAQGHGFMDRLFIGSSTLRQVVNTPHSVLILRP